MSKYVGGSHVRHRYMLGVRESQRGVWDTRGERILREV